LKHVAARLLLADSRFAGRFCGHEPKLGLVKNPAYAIILKRAIIAKVAVGGSAYKKLPLNQTT